MKFTMRGVPHSLSMATSILAPADGRAPVQRTGWSGDGAPAPARSASSRSARCFQHFTKRLNRVAGVDFVLPTDAQLDTMEAFTLASGRLNELNLANVTLTNAGAQAGKIRFVADDGAATAATPTPAPTSPRPEPQLRHRCRDEPRPRARDRAPPARRRLRRRHRDCDGNGVNDCFGDGTFNTTPLIEAADTEPFFHNNSAATIEDAVDLLHHRGVRPVARRPRRHRRP